MDLLSKLKKKKHDAPATKTAAETAQEAESVTEPVSAESKPAPAHRTRYQADPKKFGTQLSMILMAAAIVFRLIGCWGMWNDSNFAVTQIALPVLCSLVYILLLLLLGKHLIEATTLPVIVGAAFFIMSSVTSGDWLSMLLTILYCLAAVVVYCGTVFGVIRSKLYLLPLFGLPFLYRVLIKDVAALRDTLHPVTFAAGMQEMSVLCIFLSLLMLAAAMKKKQPKNRIEGDLPKMKAPKVTVPETAAPETAVPETAAPEACAEPEAQLENIPTDNELITEQNNELSGEQI